MRDLCRRTVKKDICLTHWFIIQNKTNQSLVLCNDVYLDDDDVTMDY